jgi:hypothetical protein
MAPAKPALERSRSLGRGDLARFAVARAERSIDERDRRLAAGPFAAAGSGRVLHPAT